jgi:uncharacterized membrane protein
VRLANASPNWPVSSAEAVTSKVHILKITSLLSWLLLTLSQLALPWLTVAPANYWVLLLVLPLLIPLRGLLRDQRYTYKWIGFLTMLYFCIGISELIMNPQLRLYGLTTTAASTLLFLASIYYARYLSLQQVD